MRKAKADLALGLIALALALAALWLWVPADTGSGLIERVRGQARIGDAMAPSVAFVLLALAGIVLAVESLGKGAGARPQASLGRPQLGFLLIVTLVFLVSLLAMRWIGPAVAALLTDTGYRPLRASLPWKYLGYVAGGTLMVASLIALAERRVTLRAFGIGFGAALALALLYDLPFDDFLLPPNGDL